MALEWEPYGGNLRRGSSQPRDLRVRARVRGGGGGPPSSLVPVEKVGRERQTGTRTLGGIAQSDSTRQGMGGPYLVIKLDVRKAFDSAGEHGRHGRTAHRGAAAEWGGALGGCLGRRVLGWGCSSQRDAGGSRRHSHIHPTIQWSAAEVTRQPGAF